MMKQKKTLSKLEERKSPQKVSLGDDYQYLIKGIGEASYKLDSRNPLKMKEVLFVPGIKKNLLFISALDKKGYIVAFIYGQVLMSPKGNKIEDVVVINEEERGLYKLKVHQDTTLVHETTNPSELWHRRLADVNYKELPHVNKVVAGLQDLTINHASICKGCAKGKNIKNPFLKSETKTKGTLELIHSDVCGPMSSTSLSGFEYYITFIDDYSRKTWIYFLKAKSKVFEKFKEFKAFI